ncbi:MAG TPA: protein phosphatase 2C domain-containing protein, partial [Anaerolineales bacterium]|nr:protein phosphatase 2C domain-containing protein [Anaerolineales bacterium]
MIPARRAHLNVTAVSHPGMSGKNNEDRYSVSAFSTPQNPPLPSVLAVIADGIGGHRAGEIAAEIAIETISQVIAASDASAPLHTLGEAIQQASRAIYLQAQQATNQRGMGSTCACCWIIGERLYIATVGDSRIYLVRNGAIQQISTDHTWIQEAIDEGELSPSEARNHPNAHVIRRYLGSRQPAVPDLRLKLNNLENDQQAETNQGFFLLPDDRILLCSDGLTDLVDDQEILRSVQNYPLDTALQQLLVLSNQRGGHDNITIIGLQFPDSASSAPAALPQKARQNRWIASCMMILAGIAILAVLLIGSFALGVWELGGPIITQTSTSQSSPAPGILPASATFPIPTRIST